MHCQDPVETRIKTDPSQSWHRFKTSHEMQKKKKEEKKGSSRCKIEVEATAFTAVSLMWACMIVMSSEPVWSLQMKHFLRIIQYNYSSSRPGQMNHLFHPVTLFPFSLFNPFISFTFSIFICLTTLLSSLSISLRLTPV